jgi:ABC-type multidrug transport system ATPase subunit
VNIGVELITDPRVLFLDEPTTGLDSSTALEVMMVMRELTNRGRTTIATIHQPSTDTFNLFDKCATAACSVQCACLFPRVLPFARHRVLVNIQVKCKTLR